MNGSCDHTGQRLVSLLKPLGLRYAEDSELEKAYRGAEPGSMDILLV